MPKSSKAEVVATPAAPKASKPTKSSKGEGARLVKKADKPKVFGGFNAASTVGKRVKGVVTTATEHGQLRATVGEYGHVTAVIKWFGYAGYSRAQTRDALLKVWGLDVNGSTLGCHLGAGRGFDGERCPHHNGPIAELSPADVKRVNAAVGKPGDSGDDE